MPPWEIGDVAVSFHYHVYVGVLYAFANLSIIIRRRWKRVCTYNASFSTRVLLENPTLYLASLSSSLSHPLELSLARAL